MLPSRYVVVDTETTGISASFDRIIEIGALVIENGKIVREYETFLNPGGPISPFITALTGIHDKDLEDAPTFYELADEIHALFGDAVMVAHNARFDYGFLKQEFRRINKSFSPKQLCTVRLSRALLPDLPRHNLDTLIEHFQIQVDARHRAMGDARAVFEFLQKAEQIFSPAALESAVKQVLKKPTLPQGLTQKDIDVLPDGAGVYIFYDKDGTCLYVGKSITIRERVLSHFAQDVYSATEMQIAQNVASIETIETAGELGALLKEASLVKSMAPLYNQLLRAKRRGYAVWAAHVGAIYILHDEIFNEERNTSEDDGRFATSRVGLSALEECFVLGYERVNGYRRTNAMDPTGKGNPKLNEYYSSLKENGVQPIHPEAMGILLHQAIQELTPAT